MPSGVPLFWIGGRLVALGSVQPGGADLHFDLGGAPKSLTVKSDTTIVGAADMQLGLADAGSGIIAQSFGLNSAMITSDMSPTNGSAFFVMVQILAAATATGIAFCQVLQGSYTANNTNQVGLYSYSGGTATRIAVSANNGNLWKGLSDSFNQEPFVTPVDITPGVYFMAIIYNNIGFVTNPKIAAAAAAPTGLYARLDLPNSAATYASIAGQTALPATQAMSGVGGSGAHPWLALY